MPTYRIYFTHGVYERSVMGDPVSILAVQNLLTFRGMQSRVTDAAGNVVETRTFLRACLDQSNEEREGGRDGQA